MKRFLLLSITCFFSELTISHAQSFTRSEFITDLVKPWEIIYGPDDFLWLSESGGKVLRADPLTGEMNVIYTATDYFDGSDLEESQLCAGLRIGKGTLGLALHPNFMDANDSFLYFVYSYNSGTEEDPATKFRIKRLQWDSINNEVVGDTNIVNNLPTGYDHLGGRLMAIEQEGEQYLILTIGDNGRSELSGDCYDPPSSNPNHFAQDVNTQNGKVHRFNMDGSTPTDNPIPNNSFYTRGHRNPQGLIYNPNLETLYCIEHGDDTDDEINLLHKGMNYGWKDVRGYHNDNSLVGEADYVANYQPNPFITDDALVEPIYSWCTIPSSSSNGLNWCTVAPSDGIYYGSESIPEWENSLLVVTLKDGATTDREVYQFKLQDDGELVPSTPDNVNPKKFFGEDQDINGRLRDITISPDGKSIYLINNSGTDANKIIVYTYKEPSSNQVIEQDLRPVVFPNPADNEITIQGIADLSKLEFLQITSAVGQTKQLQLNSNNTIDISHLEKGIHFIQITKGEENFVLKFMKW